MGYWSNSRPVKMQSTPQKCRSMPMASIHSPSISYWNRNLSIAYWPETYCCPGCDSSSRLIYQVTGTKNLPQRWAVWLGLNAGSWVLILYDGIIYQGVIYKKWKKKNMNCCEIEEIHTSHIYCAALYNSCTAVVCTSAYFLLISVHCRSAVGNSFTRTNILRSWYALVRYRIHSQHDLLRRAHTPM